MNRLKLLLSLFMFVCSVLVSSAQEISRYKYSYTMNTNTGTETEKYTKGSSRYLYIICVKGDRLAKVNCSWSNARMYMTTYSNSSDFSMKYAEMSNEFDLFTGQPFISTTKYEYYQYNGGYDIYVKWHSRIDAFGNQSEWKTQGHFIAIGDGEMMIGEQVSGVNYFHYYDELDEDEVDELLGVSDKDNSYKFDNVYIPNTPSYNGTYSGGSSSGSYPSASEREEKMYREQYQKRVELFNSDLSTLRLVQGGSSYVSETTIRSTLFSHQREMRRIRNEAQQKGIYIPQAYEETMSF